MAPPTPSKNPKWRAKHPEYKGSEQVSTSESAPVKGSGVQYWEIVNERGERVAMSFSEKAIREYAVEEEKKSEARESRDSLQYRTFAQQEEMRSVVQEVVQSRAERRMMVNIATREAMRDPVAASGTTLRPPGERRETRQEYTVKSYQPPGALSRKFEQAESFVTSERKRVAGIVTSTDEGATRKVLAVAAYPVLAVASRSFSVARSAKEHPVATAATVGGFVALSAIPVVGPALAFGGGAGLVAYNVAKTPGVEGKVAVAVGDVGIFAASSGILKFGTKGTYSAKGTTRIYSTKYPNIGTAVTRVSGTRGIMRAPFTQKVESGIALSRSAKWSPIARVTTTQKGPLRIGTKTTTKYVVPGQQPLMRAEFSAVARTRPKTIMSVSGGGMRFSKPARAVYAERQSAVSVSTRTRSTALYEEKVSVAMRRETVILSMASVRPGVSFQGMSARYKVVYMGGTGRPVMSSSTVRIAGGMAEYLPTRFSTKGGTARTSTLQVLSKESVKVPMFNKGGGQSVWESPRVTVTRPSVPAKYEAIFHGYREFSRVVYRGVMRSRPRTTRVSVVKARGTIRVSREFTGGEAGRIVKSMMLSKKGSAMAGPGQRLEAVRVKVPKARIEKGYSYYGTDLSSSFRVGVSFAPEARPEPMRASYPSRARIRSKERMPDLESFEVRERRAVNVVPRVNLPRQDTGQVLLVTERGSQNGEHDILKIIGGGGGDEPPPPLPPPPQPPIIVLPGFDMTGAAQLARRKRRYKTRQQRGYMPSLTSSYYGIRGKSSRVGIVSGLGIRPVGGG